MDDLLSRYGVIFIKETINNKDFYGARGTAMANLLDARFGGEWLDESIDKVNHYVNGGTANWEFDCISSELYSAWYGDGVYDIYPSVGDTNLLLQSIPAKDFRDILVLWRDFCNGIER